MYTTDICHIKNQAETITNITTYGIRCFCYNEYLGNACSINWDIVSIRYSIELEWS